MLKAASIKYLLEEEARPDAGPTSAFVFGSDQGLVGPFNDVLAAYAATTLAAKAGKKDVWAVGSRVEAWTSLSACVRGMLSLTPDTLTLN